MTYCLGWKYEEKVYIVADSATTNTENFTLKGVNQSTFGEKHDKYIDGYVEETNQKLLKINESTFVAFAGIVDIALEVVNNLKMLLDYFEIDEALKQLKSNYSQNNFELLIANKNRGENKLYYFSPYEYYEVEEHCEIGSGKTLKDFSKPVLSFLKEQQKVVGYPEELLINIIAYIQCYGMKVHLISHGVGGTIFGAYLDSKVIWCKDLFYYIYNNDLMNNQESVSVISRYDIISTASGYNGINRIFTYDKKLINDESKIAVITKVLGNYPDYIVFYSPYYNNIYVMNVNKRVHNSIMHMYIKKEKKEIKYGFIFNKDFIDMAHNLSQNNMNPSFTKLISIESRYAPREELINILVDKSNISDPETQYDIDFRELNYINTFHFNDEVIKFFRGYTKFVLIDAEYLFNKILNFGTYYKKLNVSMDDLKLENLILNRLDDSKFESYGIIALLDNSKVNKEFTRIINCLKGNINFLLLETETSLFNPFIFEYFKNIYHNEDYFHITRTYICSDNKGLNEILELTPRINVEKGFSDFPDFVLIRNPNYETEILGYYRYLNIDNQVGQMFGLSINEINLWDSYYNTKYENIIAEQINESLTKVY